MDSSEMSPGLLGGAVIRLRVLWMWVVLTATVAVVGGCDTLNIGSPGPTEYTVTLTSSNTGLYGTQSTLFTATWDGGRYPFEVTWDFGGGAEKIPAQPGTSPATVEATWIDLLEETSFTVTVAVVDANGIPSVATLTVTVEPTPNNPPVIDGVTVTDSMMEVVVHDDDDDPVSVTVSGYEGMEVDSNYKIASAVGTAVFYFTPAIPWLGASSDVTITAADGQGGTDTDTATVVIYGNLFFAPDTLYAVPLSSTVATGESLTVVVVTFETANPFQFMTGAGIVVDNDAQYVPGSFNIGAPGGITDDPDGVWQEITPNGDFLIPPDQLMGGDGPDTDGTLAPGTKRLDFNVTPLGGSELPSAMGALFNFQLTWATAGEKHIDFQEFNGVNRTYYSDGNGVNYFWSAYEGATVTVN